MACIADSIPAFSLERACRGLAAAIMSSLITPIISLAIRRLRTSPTPIAYQKNKFRLIACPLNDNRKSVHSVM